MAASTHKQYNAKTSYVIIKLIALEGIIYYYQTVHLPFKYGKGKEYGMVVYSFCFNAILV